MKLKTITLLSISLLLLVLLVVQIKAPPDPRSNDLWSSISGSTKQAVNDSGIYLSRWNDEASIFIPLPQKIASSINNGKLSYSTAGYSMNFYMKDNENFEWEIVLNNKPPRNWFEYDISMKGLTCYYQAPMNELYKDYNTTDCNATQCTIWDRNPLDQGAIKLYDTGYDPQYLGSYQCLYNKTGNKYQEGLAFTIFPIIVTDADGKNITGNIKIQNGKINISVDQKFLNTAKYPITIDPTFGNTGTANSVYTSWNNNTRIGASAGAADEDGTVYSATMYMVPRTNSTHYVAMYVGNLTHPQTKMRDADLTFYHALESAELVNFYFNASNGVDFTAGTPYWLVLGLITNGTASTPRWWATSATGGVGKLASDGYLPDDSIFGTVTSSTVYNYRVYFNYTFRPTYTSVSIVPNFPDSTTTKLNCTANFADADDTTITYEYLLYNGTTLYNSTNISTTQGTSYTVNFTISGTTNQTYTCMVRAKDPHWIYNTGASWYNATVSINNPPSVDSISITPASPVDADNLTCSANWTDLNNVTQSMTNVFTWLRNGSSFDIINIPGDIDLETSSYLVNKTDITQNNNNVSVYNLLPSYESSCVQGGCYLFNGSSGALKEGIQVTANANNSNLTNFTILTWMKALTSGATRIQIIAEKEYAGSGFPGTVLLYFQRSGGDTAFWGQLGDGAAPYGTIDAVSYGSDIADKWVHVALVVTSGSNMSLYVNGTLLGYTAITATKFANQTGNWVIGAYEGGSSYQLNAYIDNFRIINQSLTKEQLDAIRVEEAKGYVNQSVLDNSFTTAGDNWTCISYAADSYVYSTTSKIASVTINSAGGATVYDVTSTQSLGLTNNINRMGNYGRNSSLSALFNLNFLRQLDALRKSLTSFSFTPTLNRIFFGSRTSINSFTVSSAISRLAFVSKNLNSQITLTSLENQTSLFYRNPKINFAISDVLTRSSLFQRSNQLSLSMNNLVNRIGLFFRIFTNNLTLTNTINLSNNLYLLDIIQPNTTSPQTVISGENLTVYFNFTKFGNPILFDVNITNILIGSNVCPILNDINKVFDTIKPSPLSGSFTDTYNISNGATWLGKKYSLAEGDYIITNFSIKGYRSGDPQNLTLSIFKYNYSIDVPIGDAIYTGVYNGSSVTTSSSGQIVTFNVTGNEPIVNNTYYAFYIHTGNASGGLFYMLSQGEFADFDSYVIQNDNYTGTPVYSTYTTNDAWFEIGGYSKQIHYNSTTKLWEVNCTVPSGTGLNDLTLSANYTTDFAYRTDTESSSVSYSGILTRTVTLILSLNDRTSKLGFFGRINILSISPSSFINDLISTFRNLYEDLTFSNNLARKYLGTRQTIASFVVTPLVKDNFYGVRQAINSLSFNNALQRIFLGIRIENNNLIFNSDVIRQAFFFRTNINTLSLSNQVTSIFIDVGNIIIRTVSQSLTFVFDVSNRFMQVRINTQGLTLNSLASRLTLISRNIQDTFSFIVNAVLYIPTSVLGGGGGGSTQEFLGKPIESIFEGKTSILYILIILIMFLFILVLAYYTYAKKFKHDKKRWIYRIMLMLVIICVLIILAFLSIYLYKNL